MFPSLPCGRRRGAADHILRPALSHPLSTIRTISTIHRPHHHTDVLTSNDPLWASCNVGVFVCLDCSGVHRISSIGKVKSTQLDYMEHDLIQFMQRHGNVRAREEYEAFVPPFYYRPTEKDCRVLREQWIRAKYERREFVHGGRSRYSVDGREGFLWKKGRDNGQYVKRLFIFSESEGTLKYYTRDRRSGAKGVIPIQSLNVMFQCEKMGHEHGLEMTCEQDGRTRSIYVYHEDGEEIVTWYNVLRFARFNYLKKTFPETSELERKTGGKYFRENPEPQQKATLIPRITRSYTKCGYMEKTGPTQREPFKKRWFNLDSEERKLLYYKKPMDPYETGQVFIGSGASGFHVLEGFPNGLRGNRWEAGITIRTPQREYVFTCENIKEQKEWLQALRDVIARPISTQDAAADL